MTTDGVLSVLLSVAIPFLLAVLGGILAVRSLPAEKFRNERWWWIGGFLGLAIVGIVLAFIQQIVLTDEQRVSDKKASDREAQLRADSRFTQGQLDTMTKVLTSIASKPDSSNIGREMLTALATVAHQDANENLGKLGLGDISNKELLLRAKSMAASMREIEQEYKRESAPIYIDPHLSEVERQRLWDGSVRGQLAAHDSMQTKWIALQPEARVIRDELVSRLPKEMTAYSGDEKDFVPMSMDKSYVAGPSPLTTTANYLERLALLLPQAKIKR